jgi:VanZ family protein
MPTKGGSHPKLLVLRLLNKYRLKTMNIPTIHTMMRRSFKTILLSAASIALPMAVLLVDLPQGSVFWRDLGNAGHVPVFGLLSLVLLGLFRRIRPQLADPILFGAAFLATAAFGVLTEFVQFFGPRDADLYDLLRDLAGAGGFLLIVLAVVSNWSKARTVGLRWRRWTLLAAAVALLSAGLARFVITSLAFLERDRAFPYLTQFGQSWADTFLTTNNAELSIAPDSVIKRFGANETVAQLMLYPADYPGLEIREPYPDWRGFDTLAFEVYSPDGRISNLQVRIHDRQHSGDYSDRFNRVVNLQSSALPVRIALSDIVGAPRGRNLDIGEVASIILFVHGLQDTGSLYISDLHLR